MSDRRWLLGAALLVMSLGGCSLPTSGEDMSGPTDIPSAKFATPLEAREILESIGVFDACGDSISREGASIFYCFIDASATVGWQANRGVGVRAYRDQGDLDEDNVEYCENSDIPGSAVVVTDMLTFVAEGSRGEFFSEGTLDFSEWPPELWPEDIQRVLGGAVMTKQELCSLK